MLTILRGVVLVLSAWILINGTLLQSLPAQVRPQCSPATGSTVSMQGTVEIRRQDEWL
jgi:hypothetical protein